MQVTFTSSKIIIKNLNSLYVLYGTIENGFKIQTLIMYARNRVPNQFTRPSLTNRSLTRLKLQWPHTVLICAAAFARVTAVSREAFLESLLLVTCEGFHTLMGIPNSSEHARSKVLNEKSVRFLNRTTELIKAMREFEQKY